jgi:hypothetical protein
LTNLTLADSSNDSHLLRVESYGHASNDAFGVSLGGLVVILIANISEGPGNGSSKLIPIMSELKGYLDMRLQILSSTSQSKTQSSKLRMFAVARATYLFANRFFLLHPPD